MLFRTLVLRASSLPFVKAFVTRSRIFRPLVSRFVAGETLDEAMAVAEGLAERCFGVSLDLLGENVASEEAATRERDAYIRILERMKASPFVEKLNISIKLTALGLDQGDEVAERNLRQVLESAGETFVRVDMESSEYTERTVAMIERVFADRPNTGTVLQSMLIRTPADLDRMIRLGARVRIVKGAYLEPPAVAHQDKAEVDRQYVAAAKRLIKEGRYPAIATHDEAIIRELKTFIEQEGVSKDVFEWQMLFGIRRDLQERLRQEGFNVRVYIPFGESWYPYFSRRLAERPANLVFITKSLLRK
ncbi:MAG: proline dehydrogenase family protein [Fimbriimonadaceae bacterium]|nr:proline dehydrogenase family protein [Fimbriimonadaceae bacterium]QYK57667.1 MAG: proline dehydrogenase family protein [Fimbriimonadaceae bacterium]